MKIGLTYDVKTDWQAQKGEPVDANAEFDKPETIDAMQQALENGGHTVERIGNVRNLLKVIDRLDVDIVFNICEGIVGRNRESQVPVLLEMHGIPFVGADALSLGITLDKSITKKLFKAENIPTPAFITADSSENLEEIDNLSFPLIVKTCYEGTSKGLTEASCVNNLEELKRQVDFITQTYNQPALVEEFISGTEFTVAVIGNKDPQAMPIIQVSIDGSTELGDKFYTFERVSSDNLRYVCPAQISDELTKQMQDIAVRVYKTVGSRDLGRVDFRVDKDGKPYCLEINPLPSLEKADVFNIFPQVLGTTYDAVINKVVDFALERYGLLDKKEKQLMKDKEGFLAGEKNK